MARAILLEDNDNERVYQLPNGRVITIRINEYIEISYIEDGEVIGSYEDFVFIEDEFDYSKYLLARMYVPIKGQGLGRATIEFFTEYNDARVWARNNDGIERKDASHLTEDAPGFVDKMIEEGFLINNRGRYDFEEPYDYEK